MRINNILDHYKFVQKTLIFAIILLSLIVVIGFLSHQFLIVDEIEVRDFKDNSTYISFNQNFENNIINIEYLDNETLEVKLGSNLDGKEVEWEYSLDNGENWVKANSRSFCIQKDDVLGNYILVNLINNSDGEESKLSIEVPKKKKSKVAINYDVLDATKGPVKASLIGIDEQIKILNNDGLNYYIFEKNGEFRFDYEDEVGQVNSIVAKVDWIIEENFVLDVSYDKSSLTNSNVVASLSNVPEGTRITNNNGKKSYTFKENGEFTFNYIDKDGNKGSTTARVTWIDKEAPKAKIVYDITEQTSLEVTATLTNFNEDVLILVNDGSPNYTFKENGKFTFVFQDEAGNIKELTASVSWILKEDKTSEVEENETITKSDEKEEDNYLTKDAKSRKTAYEAKNITLSVPTYKIKEPLSLKKEETKVEDNIKKFVGEESTSFLLSLERANNKEANLNTNMKVSVKLDPEKKFMGVYQLNNEVDLEEIKYVRKDKNNIEFEIESLGQFILSYIQKELSIAKIQKTASDLQIFILFSTSIALIVGGITFYKNSRK